ncbi:UNC119-binding protein C5orf30 homolog isoform X2 [Parus major]|uniref:UNC119-binding protein C5orf30 homolog isoform X2 n=1 Tax=Parus major TaxID=9157 RepID=UPI001443904F|nr:UNC119-binding protein C5orf30 homolog isoform X2 [Parus major]
MFFQSCLCTFTGRMSLSSCGAVLSGLQKERSFVFKMEVDVNGESRTALSTLPVPLAEVSSAARMEAERPRCSSTPCSPLRQTVAGYQILHMDSNYLVGFATGEELLKLAHKCTGSEENKGESGPNLGSKHIDSGLPRSSRLYKTRSRYSQPYEIPAVNGRRRRRMPSSGDKYSKALPYEPYKALHGPLPLRLLKGRGLQKNKAVTLFCCKTSNQLLAFLSPVELINLELQPEDGTLWVLLSSLAT